MLKKIMVSGLVASCFLVAGCGDEPKTEQELQFKQQKELLAMQQAHERSMKDREIEMERVRAQNGNVAPVQRHETYVENTYNTETYTEQQPVQSYSNNVAPASVAPASVSYDQPAAYSQQPAAASAPAQQQVEQQDTGFGMGSMALAAVGGAAVGYFAGEMLNNGMKSYKDDHGNVHYTDKDGRPVKKEQYEAYKKANPKTTAFREKAQSAKASVASTASSVSSTVKAKAGDVKSSVQTKTQQFNNSPSVSSFRERAQQNKAAVKATPTYNKVKSAPSRAVSRSSGFGGKRK